MTRARDLADSADKDIAGTLTLDGLTVDGVASADSLGIGTDAPGVLIEGKLSDSTAYNATGNAATDAALRILNESATTGAYSALKLHSQNANGTVGQWAIASISTSNNYDNDLAFHTRTGSSTYAERMRLNNDGKLALGSDLTNADNSLLHLTAGGTNNFNLLQLESTDGGSATAPDIAFYRNSASPADGDNNGALHFYGNNSVGDRTLFGNFYNRVTDVTDGSEDSKFEMYAMKSGSLTQFLTVGSNASGTGEVVINEGSGDINFRVESNAQLNAFVVDAGTEFIGMHAGSALAPNGYTERLRIASDGSNLGGSVVMSCNNNARTSNSSENDLVFYDQDTSLSNGQGIGNIRWYSKDPSGDGEGFKIGIKGRGNAAGSAYFQFYASSSTSNYIHAADLSGNIFQPGADNTSGLGQSSKRWTDVWAVDGSINTSDERLKQQVAALSTNEINAAKAISALFKTYKWNHSVAEKGDNARIHSGIIAQQVKAAMEANSLDPMKYAFMCWNEFYEKEMSGEDIATPYVETFEVDDPEIPEGATYVDRYSIRYSELMSFIHAATEQRLASIESRLDALEAE